MNDRRPVAIRVSVELDFLISGQVLPSQIESVSADANSSHLDGIVEIEIEATHGLVTLAGGGLKALRIDNANASATVFDQPSALDGAGGDGDGDAARAKHVGKKLLGQKIGVTVDAVADHEEPARQPWFRFVLSGLAKDVAVI
jgi:hypothetical protein